MRTAFVTGGTGMIGLALIDFLAAENIQTTVLVRPGSPRAHLLANRDWIRVVEGDLNGDLSSLPLPSSSHEAFIHLGWNTASREAVEDPDSQTKEITQTLNAVALASALGAKVFVGAGSQAEYGRVEGLLAPNTPTRPESAYGHAKLAACALSRIKCDRLSIRHCWCRILSVYGPWDKPTTGIMYCIDTLLRGLSPALTPCRQQWDFLYSEDCARALWLTALAGRPGATYAVGSGSAPPLRWYFETLRDLIDPALALNFGGKPYGERQVMHLQADSSDLFQDTGFRPQVDFQEGITRTVDWRRSHPD